MANFINGRKIRNPFIWIHLGIDTQRNVAKSVCEKEHARTDTKSTVKTWHSMQYFTQYPAEINSKILRLLSANTWKKSHDWQPSDEYTCHNYVWSVKFPVKWWNNKTPAENWKISSSENLRSI